MNILKKLARWYYTRNHRIRTDEEVDEFYKDLTPFTLSAKLGKMGFSWKGELSYLDWDKTPAESLASKTRQINCGDFMAFYVELYKRLDVEYQCYLLENKAHLWKYDWHFISSFAWQGEQWIQSNNKLVIHRDIEELMAMFPQYPKLTNISPTFDI